MLITCCSGRSFFPLDAERVVARRAVYAYVAIYAYVRLKFHIWIIIQLIWVVGPRARRPPRRSVARRRRRFTIYTLNLFARARLCVLSQFGRTRLSQPL